MNVGYHVWWKKRGGKAVRREEGERGPMGVMKQCR